MTDNVFTPHTESQAEPTLHRNLELPKGVLQKNLKTFVYLGAALLVIVAAGGPPQFVPAAQLERTKEQLAALQSHVEQAVDEYKSAYQVQLKFDYTYKANEAPFDIQSIYHDDKFTYIKTNAPEKFSVYEMKDGKPNLVTYDLREGTYIIPKIMDNGYVELGKKRMEFTRKGSPS